MKTLEFTDIERIGHTTYEDAGLSVFCCAPETANIEFLLLREILALEGYKIFDEIEYYDEIRFFTNLPFDRIN